MEFTRAVAERLRLRERSGSFFIRYDRSTQSLNPEALEDGSSRRVEFHQF